jgi:GSCFA family protein
VSQPSNLLSPEALMGVLDQLLAQGRYRELETASRDVLARHRFFLWHMYLIVALLRTGRKDEAGRELEDLLSYKFNLADRAWPEIREAFPEKFRAHYVLSTMKPEVGLETQARLRNHWSVPYPIETAERFAAVVDELIGAAVPKLPALARESTRITTFGSCFAANLARTMKAAGVDASNLLIEESINSPLANREFLAAMAHGEPARHFGRIRANFGADFLERARERLRDANVLVVTLGVAPAMFHAGSDEFAFLVDYRALLKEGKLYMRTPTVEEVKAVTAEALALVREINPAARIYLSISPVPLMGTIELPHALIADCVSKTTLRAALHELLQAARPPDVHYWPSFEIVRWLGGHTPLAVFAQDDGDSRHVSNWTVELIVERFAKHLFG